VADAGPATDGGDAGCTPTPFFRDQDGDGLGRHLEPMLSCEPPEGWVASSNDCDDGDPSITLSVNAGCGGCAENTCPRCERYRDDGVCLRSCAVAPCAAQPVCAGEADASCLCPQASVDVHGDATVCTAAVQWVRSFGDPTFGGESVGDLLRDRDGNIWISGEISGAHNLGGPVGEGIWVGAEGLNAFLAKFSPEGKALWARSYNTRGSRQHDGKLAQDKDGNVWWSGGFFYEMPIGDGLVAEDFATFLAKFTPAGELLHAQAFPDVNARAIAPSGDFMWIGGNFSKTINLAPGKEPEHDLVHRGGEPGFGADGFIAQLTLDGEYLWSTSYGGTKNDWPEQMASDGKGGVWFATAVYDGVSWNDRTWSLDGEGFVAAIGSVGPEHNLDFPFIATPVGSSTIGSFLVAIASDSLGNVWATGLIREGSIAIGDKVIAPKEGFQDMILVKISPTGEVLFADSFGGGDPGPRRGKLAEGRDLAIAPDDSVWVTGSALTIDTYIHDGTPSPPLYLGYLGLAHFSAEGKHLHSARFGDQTKVGGQTLWERVVAGPRGEVTIGGTFQTLINFAEGLTFPPRARHPTGGKSDTFQIYLANFRF
jgi:hypothetical protein